MRNGDEWNGKERGEGNKPKELGRRRRRRTSEGNLAECFVLGGIVSCKISELERWA